MLSGQIASMPQKWQGAGGTAFSKLHVEWQTRRARSPRRSSSSRTRSHHEKDASVNDESQSGSMFQINKNLEQV